MCQVNFPALYMYLNIWFNLYAVAHGFQPWEHMRIT